MPPYKTFVLDEFVFGHAPNCAVSLHHSCVEPLSLADLQALDPSSQIIDHGLQLKYGPTKGLPGLRDNISALYDNVDVTANDTLVTAGAIHANFLVLDTFVEAGDHVIVQHPTYLQLVEIPRRAGAEVSLWKWQEATDGRHWEMNIAELEQMIQPNTKMIVLSTPNNPLGSILSRRDLEHIVELARVRNIFIMCDEVFRFLHHDTGVSATPSLLELGYERSIVTGSVSKGFALPGIRLGWIAVSSALRDTVLERIAHTRDYTTITVSQVDQQIASFALSLGVREKILARSRAICDVNIGGLKRWVAENRSWAGISEPCGGGTVLLKVLGKDGQPVDDHEFATALVEEESVCVPPAGLCFGHLADGSGDSDFRGYLRVGLVMKEGQLRHGLDAIARLRGRWGQHQK